jgi:hypothetical protein
MTTTLTRLSLVALLALSACKKDNTEGSEPPVLIPSDVVVSEIMAKNTSALIDEDGEASDWIELSNRGDSAVSLAGWSLSDEEGAARKWVFPDVSIEAGGYLIVFASEKDRAGSSGELHTNFKLSSGSEYIALFTDTGQTATELAPGFGTLEEDRSIGIDENGDFWHTTSPTPGAENALDGQASQANIEFSLPSGLYPSGTTVFLRPRGGNAYCTTDGEEPSVDSPNCPETTTVTGATTLRVLLVDAQGEEVGRTSRTWIALDPTHADFSSDLPIIVVESFGNEEVSGPWNREFMPIHFMTYDKNTPLSSVPSFASRAGAHVRGNSTSEYEKKQYALELRKESDKDRDYKLLGMPSEADWVLHAPYSDKTLMRNHLMYSWSNSMGRYAARTQFVEAFFDADGDGIAADDYVGVYVVMEKIEQGKDRVDIANLNPDEVMEPDISGGYLLKKDWVDGDPDNYVETERYEDILIHVYPDADDIPKEQRDWLKNYLDNFETALALEDGSYDQFIDVDSFIDHHLLVEMARNVDGYVLSTYLHKDKEGLLNMGPIWDYNGSLGNADYFEAWEIEGWHFNNSEFPADNPTAYHWYEELMAHPAFQQRYRERWADLRLNELKTSTLHANIDAAAASLETAAGRNFDRWPVLGEYVWPNDFGAEERQTYAEEVSYLKEWLEDRTAWMDAELAQ